MAAAREKPRILSAQEAEKILQKNVANIVKKAAAGKTLTAREQSLIASFQSPAAAADPTSPPAEWVSSYEALGSIFGPHRASFPRFRKQFPDAPKPRANGDHHVPAWRKFFEAHPELLDKSETPALDALRLKDEKIREQIRRIKFENEVREGQFLPRDKTLAQIKDLAELLKSKLRSALEDELPPLLQNQPAAIIRTHMKELVDRLCKEFSAAA